MFRVDIPVTIFLRGPFVTQSSVPETYGLDVAMARDSKRRVYIPGTLIEGKLRQAWEELFDVIGGLMPYRVPEETMLQELLGKGSGEEEKGSFSPFSKSLYFSDLLLSCPKPVQAARFTGPEGSNGSGTLRLSCQEPGQAARFRIEMDDQRGAVKKGAVAVIESPFSPADTPSFSGRVTFLASTKEHASHIRELIKAGLSFIHQLGAFSSIGYGFVEGAEVGRCELRPVPPERPHPFDLSQGIDVAILPDGPFCIAKRHTRENNLFVSEEIIPGNVIVGAIATMLHHLGEMEGGPFKELYENLSLLRVLHALPSKSCYQRPVALPLSLVKVNDKLFDLAFQKGPCLINGAAPSFQVDWKDNSSQLKEFGWPVLKRELRVRTAINRDKGRSLEKYLFAYEMVAPDDEVVWLTRISAERIENNDLREKVLGQLSALLSIGLLGIGKTKTTATVKVHRRGTVSDRECLENIKDVPEKGQVVITLQSPALILCPKGLLGDDRALDETASHRELFLAYKRAWYELSNGELTLSHFYAAQRLSGGNYQYHRFMKREYEEDYYPWILTERGSVFVFNVNDWDNAKKKIEEWLKNGLPIPGPVRKFYHIPNDEKKMWKRCPFIPQNGFGEIGVNMEAHSRLMPQKVEAIKLIAAWMEEDNGS